MNSLVYFFLLLIVTLCVGKDLVIHLNDKNFNSEIESTNFYVVFVKDNEFEGFNTFWNKVSQLYNNDESSSIKFAKVNCKESPTVCQEQDIDELLELKFYGNKNDNYDWKPISKFIDSTIETTLKNYYEDEKTKNQLKTGKHFVKFFAPFCHHCHVLAPKWEELEKQHKDNRRVSLHSIDCVQSSSICDSFNISAYPQLIWFEDGVRIAKYSGERVVKSINNYITKMLGAEEPPTPTSSEVARSQVIKITEDNFEEIVEKDFTFVYFYLKGCAHCKHMNELWPQVAERFANNNKIKIGKVDSSKNYWLYASQAKGCPTLNLYEDGELIVKDYHETETLEGISDCINSHMKGGQDLIDWKEREKEKRRIRKAEEKKEKEADAKCQESSGEECKKASH